MTETNYQTLWADHERLAHEAFDIDMRCGADPVAWNKAARRTLMAFLADLYVEYWRPTYTLLGLDMPGTLSVLQARAAEVHHWPPNITDDMDKEALFKALATDFSHCPLPARAIQAVEFGLGNLPEKRDVVDRLRAQAEGHQARA
ncbi:hypothetical protein ACJ7V3_11735 [Halomonas elongata]|uniref:hypothetical protein n=1 Tax=Halomonas elongata TaxID=2746 RepID=UPI0038D46D11